MNKIILLIILTFNLTNINAQTFINREWQDNYGNPLLTQWTKTIITQNGDIITVGNTTSSNQGSDILLTRYDNTSNLLWSYKINNTGNTNDYGTDVVEDNNGDVYVCGITDNNSTTNYDVMLIKINSIGIEWTKTYNSSYAKNDFAISLTALNGNIYICASSESTTNNYDYLTLKYDASSSFIWEARYDYATLNDFPVGITTDGVKVYVTGSSASTNNNWDYTTVYYDIAGNYLTEKRDNVLGNGYDQPTSFLKDNLGNLYITGKGSVNGVDYDMKTIKIDNTYNVVWEKTYDEFGYEDQANSIAIDGNSNIIIAGYSVQNNNIKNAKLIKYDNAGNELSSYTRISDDPTGDANIKAISTNANNEILIVCEIKGNNGKKDIALIKLNENCVTLWERKIESLINKIPTSIKVGNNGNIFVTYIQEIGGTSSIYSVEKYTEHKSGNLAYYDASNIPTHMKNELVITFKHEAINIASIDNTNVEYSNLAYFLKPQYYSIIENKLSFLCTKANPNGCYPIASKVFKSLKTNMTTTKNRLGQTIDIPIFWNTFRVEFSDGVDINQIVDSLKTIPNVVVNSEYNYIIKTLSTPNDINYSAQIGLNANAQYPNASINIEPAWNYSTGNPYIKTAVLDEGINFKHEDLIYGSNSISKVKGGWDWTTNSDLMNNPYNDGANAHGTSVAGIIGALRNNNLGIAGIAGGNNNPLLEISDIGTSLYALKIIPYLDVFAPITNIYNAIVSASLDSNFAPFYGVHIMNNSWRIDAQIQPGTPANLLLLTKAVHFANRANVTFIAGRGNEGADNQAYPAVIHDDWVLSVGGSDTLGNYQGAFTIQGGVQSGSSYGSEVDVIAPYFRTLTKTLGYNPTDYKDFGGTSCSTPHVSGVAALLMSYLNAPTPNYKNLSPEDIENIIQMTATDITNDPYLNQFTSIGKDDLTGWGRLNGGKALQRVDTAYYKLKHFGTNSNSTFTKTFTIESLNDTLNNVWYFENEINQYLPTNTNYKVEIYRIDATVNHNLSNLDTIVTYWARPSSSTVLYQASTVNWWNKKLYLREHVYIDTITNSVAKMHGYIYHVKNMADSSLGWYPYDTTDLNKAKFEYTILTRHGSYDPLSAQINASQNNIVVYPNPTEGNQIITLNSIGGENLNVNLFNINGQKMNNIFNGKTYVGINTIKNNISNLPNGVYYYQVTLDNEVSYIKIIKQ